MSKVKVTKTVESAFVVEGKRLNGGWYMNMAVIKFDDGSVSISDKQ